ncbi:MAG: hypothetical protein P1V51_11935 [Deltaproteobacteria bacterium]|nr:hypothetical protein [Deltaproteobacteria bacterium]
MRTTALLPALLLGLALPGPASAGDSSLETRARLDLRGGSTDTYALDEGESGGGSVFGARLRLDASYAIDPALKILAQVDLTSFDLYTAMPEMEGLGWTDAHPGFGGRSLRFDPRHLYAVWTTSKGQLRVGAQSSQWGLGLVASSGDSEPIWGVARNGDLVFRALFITRPLEFLSDGQLGKELYLGVGGDLVHRDENAELFSGDRALQAVGSLIWRHRPGQQEVGIYLAYRAQKDRADTAGLRADLNVLVADAYGRWQGQLFDGLSGLAEGELALLTGHTTRLRPEASPDGVDVLALGWAAHGELKLDEAGVSAGLWAVYASGDQNTEDDQLRRMRLDPDFKPSLILFERVLADSSARNRARIADPSRTNIPQAGSQFLPTGGSVSGAFLVGPVISYDTPLAGLSVKAGLMWARATADLEDPYASFATGGTPVNLQGGKPDRELGLELDLGLRYERQLTDTLSLVALAEGGYFLPGAAFAGVDTTMDPILAGYLAGRLQWRLP